MIILLCNKYKLILLIIELVLVLQLLVLLQARSASTAAEQCNRCKKKTFDLEFVSDYIKMSIYSKQ